MPINEVIASIQRLADLHAVMVDISERKKQFIIKNNVEELSKLLTHEARGIKMIDEEERRRLDAVTRFLFALGIRLQGRMSVSELAKMVRDPQEKMLLLKAKERLAELVLRLKAQNEINAKLIEQSLKYINFSMDLMVGAPDSDYIYTKPAANPYETARRGICNFQA